MKKTPHDSLLNYNSASPLDTFNYAKEFALKINSPCLISLEGDLGSGKTTFAKGFAEGIGVLELITSPTFLGVNEYYSGRFPFIHMDFYNKLQPNEFISHYLLNNAIVLVEWFSLSSGYLSLQPNISVCISFNQSNYIGNHRCITTNFYQ